MIPFTCPRCDRGLQAADELAGKKTKCPRCGELLRIPASATVNHPGAAADPEGVTLPPAPPAEPATEAVTVGPGGTLPQAPAGAGPAAVPGYEILGELGRGGMGVIYKARQVRPRRLVALKMILAGEHAGPEALARFKAEAEAVARLSHANIVQVYEVGEHNGRPFLTLEFVDGGNLAQRLSEGRLKFRDCARLLYQLARAVQFALGRGIIHRDLKPANVLLARNEEDEEDTLGIPKISDFGLAKQVEGVVSVAGAGPRTQSGAIMGTPAYMAPEQAAGRSRAVGPAVDVYALGAILYECLTGRPPFQADSIIDLLMKVATEEPVPPRKLRSKCPRDLETICMKCQGPWPSCASAWCSLPCGIPGRRKRPLRRPRQRPRRRRSRRTRTKLPWRNYRSTFGWCRATPAYSPRYAWPTCWPARTSWTCTSGSGWTARWG
jgi:serine/threonine protein kinase